MKDIEEKLSGLAVDKLIDVVQNYRRYGYDETVKETALSILDKRGFDLDFLNKTGSLENNLVKSAEESFSEFNKYSMLSIVTVILFIAANIAISILFNKTISSSIIGVVINLFLLGTYAFFLIKSYIAQNRFYKIIGKDEISENIALFLIIGAFLYVFYYFYLRKNMKEQLKSFIQ